MNNTVLSAGVEKKVNYQFKIVYAMLMFCVLCGHLGIVENFVPWTELFSVYGFGIQLFLFVSGYFYSSKNDCNFLNFTVKKVKKLLVPYFLWNVFYGVVCFGLVRLGFSIVVPLSFESLVVKPILGIPVFFFNSPTWFIIPFFLAEVFTVFERFLLSKWNSYKKDIVIMTVNFLISFAGIYLAKKYVSETGYVIPRLCSLTRAMFMLPYFSLGYIYKTYLEKKDNLPSRWYFLILILLGVLYILFNGHTSSYFVVVMGGFENPITPMIVSLLGIAFYLRIARVLTPVIGKSKWVIAIGDNTFAIMIHHMLGFFILELILLVCSKVLPFLPSFDMDQFMTDANYRYMPRGRGFPLVYVIFGLFFSIYFQKLINFIKTKIVKKIFEKKEIA